MVEDNLLFNVDLAYSDDGLVNEILKFNELFTRVTELFPEVGLVFNYEPDTAQLMGLRVFEE